VLMDELAKELKIRKRVTAMWVQMHGVNPA
jgi:hypothetical protein